VPSPKANNKGPSLSSLIREAGKSAKTAVEALERQQIDLVDASGAVVVPVPQPNAPRIFSVLDYIEQGWGLGLNLFPVQRFIVKLYYHLPLDNRNKTIEIPDMFRERVLYHFTETEYLQYLYDQGRCNISEQDHPRRELILAIGRRSGKSTLAGIFASYEVYRLLNLHNPQQYYGLPPGNRIQIISIGTDKDQAGILFNEVTSHLNRCNYFTPYIGNNTQSLINFRTPADIEKYGESKRQENGKFVSFAGKATIRVTFKSCIAKGLRGFGNIVIILDEMAHFKDAGQSSAKDIYDAVTPSKAAFSPKDPNDPSKPIGDVEGRVICISSPLNRQGQFYELFHTAMSRSKGSEELLAIQAPTWEVNPTVPSSFFKQKYYADPSIFMTEFGAQFSDRVRGWIEREIDLLECIDPNLRPKDMGHPRYPHQMGIDIGLIGDGTSIFITSVENDQIVLAYHETWYAGVDWKETNPHLGTAYSTPYARELANVERLDFDAIAEWIHALSRRFYITDGIFDRWNGIPLEQALLKKGLKQFKSEFFRRDLASQIYQNAKLMMFDKKLRLYNWPKPKESFRHSPFIQELLSLQAQQISRNLVLVSAPETAGFHDDMSDAFVRAIWLSSQRMTSTKIVLGPTETQASAGTGMSLARYQMARARRHGAFMQRIAPQRNAARMRGR